MNAIASVPRLGAQFAALFLKNRKIITTMTVRDFKANYLGSYLSFLWAFIHPCVTLGLFLFVFEVGFKAGPVKGQPFALWLAAGMAPWLFISDAAVGAAQSVVSYSYLVKKVVFMVGALPIIRILSAFLVHLFFLAVYCLLLLALGRPPALEALQLIYYAGCALALTVGVGWLTSALAVFARDVSHVMTAFTQVGMWATPIVWNVDMLPEPYRDLMRLNPVFYIVEGYRDSLLLGGWFWDKPQDAMLFWAITGGLLLVGALVFYRLRPHFADVL